MEIEKNRSGGKKIGLALGGGGARGLAHIGVLEVIEKEKIPVDMIVGTSMGAMVGSLYASGKTVSQIKKAAIEMGSKRLSLFLDPALPKTGLVRGKRIENTLKSVIGDIEFADLKIPFACVATDIYSGEEVVLNEGKVWEAVRASGSIPVLFSIAKREGKYLVDGGLVDPIPVNPLREMGADAVIAVNVMPERTSIKETAVPNIFSIIMQMYNISSSRVVKSSLNGANVIIQPDVEHIGIADLHRVRECIEVGKLAAEQMVGEIKRSI